MALASSSQSSLSLVAYSNINLVPLRINVVSDDRSLAIVDTMVLDRYCWPVPLTDPIEEALERNADELAYTLLSDLEVHGMGRTVRHFTNRTDTIWSTAMQQKIKMQLLPQLRHVLRTTKMKLIMPAKKRKLLQEEDSTTTTSSKKVEEDSMIPAASTTTSTTTITHPPKRKKKASLVPVRLRLCVNGVRIHDDFIWDLNVPQCPMEFAQSLGKDLNLSDEAVVAIMTSIVEQLDGSIVEDTKDLDANTPKKQASAAWPLDHKLHVANVTQLLTIHQPQQQQQQSQPQQPSQQQQSQPQPSTSTSGTTTSTTTTTRL
jgi:SNF5 / SMARCB1 / INI1